MMIIFDDNEVVVRDDQIFPVDLPQNVGLQDIGGRAGGKQVRLEKNETIDP